MLLLEDEVDTVQEMMAVANTGGIDSDHNAKTNAIIKLVKQGKKMFHSIKCCWFHHILIILLHAEEKGNAREITKMMAKGGANNNDSDMLQGLE